MLLSVLVFPLFESVLMDRILNWIQLSLGIYSEWVMLPSGAFWMESLFLDNLSSSLASFPYVHLWSGPTKTYSLLLCLADSYQSWVTQNSHESAQLRLLSFSFDLMIILLINVLNVRLVKENEWSSRSTKRCQQMSFFVLVTVKHKDVQFTVT